MQFSKSIPTQRLKKSFPIEPYSIQLNIAQEIYKALNQNMKKLMIIQSPTGTGKSFSLLVPILNWLQQNKFKFKEKSKQKINQDKQKDLQNQKKSTIPLFLLKKVKQNNQNQINKRIQDYHKKQLSNIVDIQQIVKNKKNRKKHLNNKQLTQQNIFQKQKYINFEQIDFQQIQMNKNNKQQKQQSKRQKGGYHERLIQRQLNITKQDIPVKLIFVSRTHSQLQQILRTIQQIKKCLQQQKQQQQQVLCLTIGSKQHLCVNTQIIQSNNSQGSINQKCQYILQHSNCQYFHDYKIRQFFNKSLQQIKKQGQSYKLCGYYALRNMIESADIILLPYSSIVNQQIRNKIGININNSIIVFDQGHNLLDFIQNSHSPQIIYQDVLAFYNKINAYLSKYQKQIKLFNKNVLNHLNTVLQAIMKFIKNIYQQKLQKGQNYHKISTIQLIIQLNLTNIKIHQIKQLFNLQNFDKKIVYFTSQPELKLKNQQKSLNITKIHQIILWIQSIYVYKQSKIQQIVLIKNENDENSKKQLSNTIVKLFSLDCEQLSLIIDQSRLSIVAGGTMQPLNQFSKYILKYPHQVLKYPHIIQSDQCRIKIAKRFQQKQIKFNYENLKSQKQVLWLINLISYTIEKVIQNTQVHQGIVVFIQSYKIVQQLSEKLKQKSFYDCLIFDTKNINNQVINHFQKYQQRLSNKKRSILISVMGGKLSEGINFSDNLARKLIVFGLPYPNIKAPQIIQQMKFYNQKKYPNLNGQIYYESLCLKTLNQTIGRAIRHKNDWAEIYLIDKRFQTIKDKLSQWMKKSTQLYQKLEDIFKN